jgi:hypothetical protein
MRRTQHSWAEAVSTARFTLRISTVRDFPTAATSLEKVIFCCFSAEDLALYERYL